MLFYLVDFNYSLPNGYNDASDTSSKSGVPTGWINTLAGGEGAAAAGAGGQSTISRKSGTEFI